MTKCQWNGDQRPQGTIMKVRHRCDESAQYQMPFYDKPYCRKHFVNWMSKKQKSIALKPDSTTGLTLVILLESEEKVWVIYDGRAHDQDLVDDSSVYVALCAEDGYTREKVIAERDEDWEDGAIYEYDSVEELLPGEAEGGKTHDVLRNQEYIP